MKTSITLEHSRYYNFEKTIHGSCMGLCIRLTICAQPHRPQNFELQLFCVNSVFALTLPIHTFILFPPFILVSCHKCTDNQMMTDINTTMNKEHSHGTEKMWFFLGPSTWRRKGVIFLGASHRNLGRPHRVFDSHNFWICEKNKICEVVPASNQRKLECAWTMKNGSWFPSANSAAYSLGKIP